MTADDMLEELAAALREDPTAAATLQRDLHAILIGQPTIADYSPRRRALIRLALGPMTPDELATLIGPAETAG